MPSRDFFKRSLANMGHGQLAPQGISSGATYRAFSNTPRHVFLPEQLRHLSYSDAALPAGDGGISLPPAIFGTCLEALRIKQDEKLLFIGGDYGYEAAVCAHLCDDIYVIEKQQHHCSVMKQRFHDLELSHAKIIRSEHYNEGHRADAPYDVIIVSGAFPADDVAPEWINQLRDNGRILRIRIPSPSVAMATLSTLRDGALIDEDITHIYLPDTFRLLS